MSDDTVHALDLAAGVVVIRRAEDTRRNEGLVQANSERLVKRVSRSETRTSGSPTSWNKENTKFRPQFPQWRS